MKTLKQDVAVLKGLLREQQQAVDDKDSEITELKNMLQTVQDEFHRQREVNFIIYINTMQVSLICLYIFSFRILKRNIKLL